MQSTKGISPFRPHLDDIKKCIPKSMLKSIYEVNFMTDFNFDFKIDFNIDFAVVLEVHFLMAPKTSSRELVYYEVLLKLPK